MLLINLANMKDVMLRIGSFESDQAKYGKCGRMTKL